MEKAGMPSGDLYELPTSPKTFPDGAHYRVEISGMETPKETSEEKLSRGEGFKLIKRLLDKAKVTPRQKEIFSYWAGLSDFKPKTYKQTAKHFGISEQSVRVSIFRTKNAVRYKAGL